MAKRFGSAQQPVATTAVHADPPIDTDDPPHAVLLASDPFDPEHGSPFSRTSLSVHCPPLNVEFAGGRGHHELRGAAGGVSALRGELRF